jgi:predicted nucleotidyltransferase
MNSKLTEICHQHGITLAILFGSRATERTHSKSDIDLAILIEKVEPDKLQLIYELADILNGEIDLVILTNDTDPILLYEIFSTGKILYEKRDGLFIEQYLRAWHIWQDTEKIRDWQKKYLHNVAERLKEDVPSGDPE